MPWLGKHLDLHSTALGEALASHMPSENWQRLAKQHKRARHNDATTCSPARLIRELTLTQDRGYPFDNASEESGLAARSPTNLEAPHYGT
jgi:DNA-binding IclR family transcriptional regulator